MRVIDSHCHIGQWAGPAFLKEYDPLGATLVSARDVAVYLATHDLSAAIVMPHYRANMTERTYRECHDTLFDVLESVDGAFGAILVSPEYEWASVAAELESMSTHPKVVALKIAPNTWRDISLNPASWGPVYRKRMEKILRVAVDRRLPLQTHTGGGNAHAGHLAGFVAEFGTTVDLHCVHMGGRTSGHFVFVPVFCEWLLEEKRVYCDCSWARPFASRWLVRELRSRGLSSTNVLFASDEPWGSLPMELARMQELNLASPDAEAIFYGNARELYFGGRDP